MLDKIISGGQTGADRAALDTAIKFNIPHGGCIPKGRKTEDGPLPLIYRLKEMDTSDYPARTRQNILDSDGTVIISRGPLSGGSKLTFSFSRRSQRPVCHIDLFASDIFEAALVLHSFILEHGIRVLNVAGPRASHDPGIYRDVKSIVEAMLYLSYLESEPEAKVSYPDHPAGQPFPKDFSSALALMAADLDLKAKAGIARMDEREMLPLYFSLLDPVKQRLGIDQGNTDLVKSLEAAAGMPAYTPEDGVMDLLKALRDRFKDVYALRIMP